MAHLRRNGTPYMAINLEPVLGPIDRYVQAIDAAVQQLEMATHQAPIVVAHSMGGLAVRAWLRDRAAERRVHSVITIGTPHAGCRHERPVRLAADPLAMLNPPAMPNKRAPSSASQARLERENTNDDIYEKIVYDGFEVHNLVTLCPELRERAVIVNGVSKTYAMTGWRIGYALGPSDVIAAAAKIQSQSTSNPTSIAQAAALEAVRGQQEEVAIMVSEFQKRRDAIVEGLNAIEGFRCRKPEGAFYVFPNIAALLGRIGLGKKLNTPCDFADYLLEEAKVAAVPGEDFGSPAHIRFSYATSLRDIDTGCARIREAVRKLN